MEEPEFDETVDAIHHERPMRIICVGAGASGLCFAYKIQRSFQNFSLTIYEKNSGVSGTWYENTYPGCACDIPAHNYTFSFEPKHDWSSVYASSAEINDYFNEFANKYSLHKYIKTRREVIKACWSEVEGKWNVTIEDLVSGHTFEDSCDILIQAAGYLNKWKWPNIQGLDKFKGAMLHTAKWNNKVELQGKRVGLIGNGPSGIQAIPAIQPIVETLTVFIRSPTWVLPTIGTTQRVYSREEIEGFLEDPVKLTAQRKANETMMNSIFNSRLQKRLKARCIDEMKQTLQNDDLAEKFIPKYSVGCSRLTPCPGHTARFMPRTVWAQDCRSPFKTTATNGIPSLWPGSTLHYMEALKELRADDWEIRCLGNRIAFLGNGLSQAEFDPTCDLGYYVKEKDDSPWASRRKRREVLTMTGTQKERQLHVPCRPDPNAIVLESKTE